MIKYSTMTGLIVQDFDGKLFVPVGTHEKTHYLQIANYSDKSLGLWPVSKTRAIDFKAQNSFFSKNLLQTLGINENEGD